MEPPCGWRQSHRSALAFSKAREATQATYASLLLSRLLGWLHLTRPPSWLAGRWGEVLAEYAEAAFDRGRSIADMLNLPSALIWAASRLGWGGGASDLTDHARRTARMGALGAPDFEAAAAACGVMAVAEQLVLDHKAVEAMCCMLMFESCARPAELAAASAVMRARVLAVPSKTVFFDVSVALELPRQAWVDPVLLKLANSCRTGERLWDFDHTSLGRRFAAAESAGLGPLQECLCDLRHGGATHDRACVSLPGSFSTAGRVEEL